jgi:NitT/TauT family transport system ATP-binding protein
MTTPSPRKVEVQAVSKSFHVLGNKAARLDVLQDISFSVDKGDFLCILGPSGSGKTTLLRIIDGLIQPDAGRVIINGKAVSEPNYDRAFVFQEINLLPWRTVLGNVLLGLELKEGNSKQATDKAMSYLTMVGLEKFRDYYPYQLSGGMKQRVGIARALVVDPEIILFDEPFGFLDALTRELLQVEFSRIIEQTNKTAIFVTHNIDEAIFLGDRVIVLSPRPATVKKVVEIDIGKPRAVPDTKLTSAFSEYKKILWEALINENEPTKKKEFD